MTRSHAFPFPLVMQRTCQLVNFPVGSGKQMKASEDSVDLFIQSCGGLNGLFNAWM